MNNHPVASGLTILRRYRGRSVEPALQRLVGPVFRQRPGEASAPRPPNAIPWRPSRSPRGWWHFLRFDMPAADSLSTSRILRMGNLGPGMPRSLRKRSEAMPIRGSPNRARHTRPQAGRDRPKWVVAICSSSADLLFFRYSLARIS